MGDSDVTPPHHPTYSVHLSDPQIKDIFSAVFDEVQVLEIHQLQRGESFNNRIYFITTLIGSSTKEFALKVSGHFFGSSKVENEVSCFTLLAYYCPKVPVPRIVAWSFDGAQCEVNPCLDISSGHETIHSTPKAVNGDLQQSRSWILLERLPGQRLVIDENTVIDAQHSSIMKQLASHVSAWRNQVPQRRHFGNFRMRRQYQSSQSSFLLEVSGLILCENIDQDCHILSKSEYFQKRIEDALGAVRTKPSFPKEHYQKVLKMLESIDLQKRMEGLAIFGESSDQDAFFTHYDFAPRNMLVTTNEETGDLEISGILDMEFAGYFPVEEEFTNDLVGNEGDWPLQLYRVYLDELDRLGCQVPDLECGNEDEMKANSAGRKFGTRQWQDALLLTHLLDDIAPWRIGAGTYKGEELAAKLSEALTRIEGDIQKILEP